MWFVFFDHVHLGESLYAEQRSTNICFLFKRKGWMLCPGREERTVLVIASEIVALSSEQFVMLLVRECKVT